MIGISRVVGDAVRGLGLDLRASLAANSDRVTSASVMPAGKAAIVAERDVSSVDLLNPLCTITTTIEVSLDAGAHWIVWGGSVAPGNPLRDLAQPTRLTVKPAPPAGALVRVRYAVSGTAGLAGAGLIVRSL